MCVSKNFNTERERERKRQKTNTNTFVSISSIHFLTLHVVTIQAIIFPEILLSSITIDRQYILSIHAIHAIINITSMLQKTPPSMVNQINSSQLFDKNK